MSNDSQRPIVVKKIKKGGHGHHGGAWKIAYADFVTAMMAFFLLMWLLTSVNKAKLRGISEYFKTPVQAALMNLQGTGTRSSVIEGGGEDLSKTSGEGAKRQEEVSTEEAKAGKEALSITEKTAEQAREAKEKQSFQELEQKVKEVIATSATLSQIKDQIQISMTAEGLRIQLMDEQNRPMFSSGSAVLQAYSKEMLRELGGLLNNVPNRVSIAGHTDAAPYSGSNPSYTNWDLSSERANESRRELMAGGMMANKVLRVVGLADAVPFNPENVFDPVNRRISITVLNNQTEQNILKEMTRNTLTPATLKQSAHAGG